MKRKIKINKALLAISISTVIISGCGNNYEETNIKPKEETKVKEEEKVNEEVSIKNEEELIQYFVSLNDNLEKTYNNARESEMWDKFKSTCYNISTTTGDFILEDGSIGGYTFNELSTGTKQKIIELTSAADKKIIEYFPEYKETIRNKYTSIKSKFKEVVVDFVGESEYEFWGDKKDEALEWGKEKIENGKEKVKELYKNYKDKHETSN